MKKIIAFAASTSKESINQKLVVYAGGLLEDVELNILDLNDFEATIYSIDKETQDGFPDEIQELNSIFDTADGFVISMAEHNGSYSAAFKNAYDWLSRMEKNVWRNKPMLLMATSPGARGGKGVLDAASATFPRMGANVIATFSLPSFHNNFKSDSIIDNNLQKELKEKIELFSKVI